MRGVRRGGALMRALPPGLLLWQGAPAAGLAAPQAGLRGAGAAAGPATGAPPGGRQGYPRRHRAHQGAACLPAALRAPLDRQQGNGTVP